MTMTPARIAAKTAALLLMAASAPVLAAQPAPAAPVVAPAAPPAWTVSPDPAGGSVQIAATAKGGAAHFAGGCSKSSSDPGLAGSFSAYNGAGLRTDGEIERVGFYVRGGEWQDAFSVQIRYVATRGAWEIAKPIAPVFLDSFARGATLAVVNSGNQEVFAFDLTGSTAAARAMRSVCGLVSG